MAALPLAAAAFWSPIGAAGVAVLFLAALLHRACKGALRQAITSPLNWLAAAFAVPLCLYLIAGSGSVPHGPLLALRPIPEALLRWAAFLAIEILPWAAPIALLLRGGLLLRVSLALLCLLPGYVFGPGNEMVSRGGMGPLAVLAVAAGAALLVPWRAPLSGASAVARLGLRMVAALALAGAMMEASLLVTKRPWPASDVCSVPEAARQSVFRDSTDWSHYLASWPDAGLRWWMAEPRFRPVLAAGASPPCWPHGRP
jgi:hypothetical protein